MDEINIEKTVLFDVVSFMNEVRFSCSDKRSDEINLGNWEAMDNLKTWLLQDGYHHIRLTRFRVFKIVCLKNSIWSLISGLMQ